MYNNENINTAVNGEEEIETESIEETVEETVEEEEVIEKMNFFDKIKGKISEKLTGLKESNIVKKVSGIFGNFIGNKDEIFKTSYKCIGKINKIIDNFIDKFDISKIPFLGNLIKVGIKLVAIAASVAFAIYVIKTAIAMFPVIISAVATIFAVSLVTELLIKLVNVAIN